MALGPLPDVLRAYFSGSVLRDHFWVILAPDTDAPWQEKRAGDRVRICDLADGTRKVF